MRKLKLFVCGAFIAGFVGISLYSSERTTGQSGTLSAPTGVIASDLKYNNKVRVEWDTIRDATSYRVFRGTTSNPAAAIEIGTTAANTFLDSTAVAGQPSFYWVRAENASSVSLLSNGDQGTRAIGTQQGPVAPLEAPPVPPANPITASKVYLGKALFWDEQMSSTKTVSCGTCHQAAGGGDDLRAKTTAAISTNPGLDQFFGNADDIIASRGIPATNADGTYSSSTLYGFKEQVTGRSSMSYLNAGYSPILFWDGRALGTFRDPLTNAIVINNGGALESQVIGPPVNSTEMGHAGRDWTQVSSRITNSKPLAVATNIPAPLQTWIGGRTYAELFNEVFGTPEVTPARIAMAIATYERTQYSDQTPLDMANAGITPLTQQEQNGRNLFVQVECAVCHAGALGTDNSFRYIGVRPPNDDTGRFQVTANNGDLGRFRVPSLRNVELRGTFFHNGRFDTLEQIVAFYNRGGDFNAPNKDPDVRPRGLNGQQQADIAAFLRRPWTDPRVTSELPPFDRPMLYAQSNRVPVITGTGVAGSNARIPLPMAIEPPLLGNPSFTVAVSNALGGANAVLVIDTNDPGTASIPASGSFTRRTLSLQGNGAGNGFGSVVLSIPNNPALLGQTFYGRWYVTDAGSTSGIAVSPAFRFTVFGEAPAVSRAKFVDFDGDGKTDISVYRPDEGNWYILSSSTNSFSSQHFGNPTDKVTPADYDGDGKTDVAVFRDGTWYELRSTGGVTVVSFGLPGDVAQPGDFDGDNKADVAIFRPSDGNWWWQSSVDGVQRATHWGISTDVPVGSDYDGDGKTDFAVYRGGTWYINKSTGGTTIAQFGLADDKPVIGDYDADGKADIAVFRPSTGVWYSLRSSDGGFSAAAFGLSSDVPTPGDYDGDGINDLAVYRDGTWYLQRSATGFSAQQFGLTADKPIPSAFVP